VTIDLLPDREAETLAQWFKAQFAAAGLSALQNGAGGGGFDSRREIRS
jgi:hypothetical protein